MADLSAEQRIYDSGVVASKAVLPGPPTMWSYSSLRNVETCPRRYVLSRADYPDLWDKHGYPHMPNPAAIRGDVVHGALEIIVSALTKAGCGSTRSADAVGVLRALGGYTAVAEQVLERQMARFDGNPRVSAQHRDRLTRTLTDWLPEAREQIQTYLNRMDLAATSRPASSGSRGEAAPPSRFPAQPGDHTERELVAQNLRLHGRVDLLSVASDGATITDFKTGAEDPAHHDQLRTYALLWSADSVVNPDGLPISSLVAAYPNHEVFVPVPDASELSELTSAVARRVSAADEAVAATDPAARVGEHCAMCTVRPLCDAYWTAAPKTSDVAQGTWYDLQGTVMREHGVKSWVVCETTSGREVLVRTPAPSLALPIGKVVRILGVKRAVGLDAEDDLIAAMTRNSEVFELAD